MTARSLARRISAGVRRPRSAGSRGPRSAWRRRLGGVALVMVALAVTGGVYSVFAPRSDAQPKANEAIDVRNGQALFDTSCITCHGANLQGVHNKGPSLVGVGAASVYFQLSTGRMPLPMQGSQAERRAPKYTLAEIEQIMAYVQSVGGGPQLPSGNLRNGDVAEGGELFRLNCASCHNLAARGGALSSGKHAPSLSQATDRQIYAAMLSGPESMPVFGDNQITPAQKRAIINYVQSIKEMADPGGSGIGRIGPVSEGLVIWVGGIGALLLVVLWIGAKA